MPELKILSQNVLKIRQAMGESQIEFSANCGISARCLSHIECAIANPKFDTLQNIAAYSNCTVADLITEKEDGAWIVSSLYEKTR